MPNAIQILAEPLDGPEVPAGYDPELLYVECGRCGAPIIWEPGKATRILSAAGIDPLELDPSCLLLTDGCPHCTSQGPYVIQIVRFSNKPQGQRPPQVGHA